MELHGSHARSLQGSHDRPHRDMEIDPNGVDPQDMFKETIMVPGLDFTPGCHFAADIKRSFFSMVHPTFDSGHFIMVVSFGRASFKLTDDSVALALEVVLGGFSDKLQVSILRDRTLSFNVSSKQVGFRIFRARYFNCKHFVCTFHL